MVDYTASKERCEVLEFCNHPEEMFKATVYDGKTGYCGIHTPAFITVDLFKIVPIREISFLLWDYRDPMNHDPDKERKERMKYAYRLLVSSDRVCWSVVDDSLCEFRRGWQLFTFEQSVSARYVRIHALANRMNSGFHVVRIHVCDTVSVALNIVPSYAKHINDNQFEREIGDQNPLSNRLTDLAEQVYHVLPKTQAGELVPAVKETYLRFQMMLFRHARELYAVDGKIDEVRNLIAAPIRDLLAKRFAKEQRELKWTTWISFILLLAPFISIIVELIF